MNREDSEAYILGAVGMAEGYYKYYVRPNSAVMAWGALVAGVTAYDVWAIKSGNETMSHAFHRAYEHPVLKYGCVAALGALALHLLKETGDTKTPLP